MPGHRVVISFVALTALGALLGLGFAYLWADPATPHHCSSGAPTSACQYPRVIHVGVGLAVCALVGLSVATVIVVLRHRFGDEGQ